MRRVRNGSRRDVSGDDGGGGCNNEDGLYRVQCRLIGNLAVVVREDVGEFVCKGKGTGTGMDTSVPVNTSTMTSYTVVRLDLHNTTHPITL